MYDVIIVGGGPAGLSAALVLGRCRRRVLVCDDGHPRNAPSHGVHGFLSRDGVEPAELLRTARRQLEPYGVAIEQARVIDATQSEGGFEVTLDSGRRLRAVKLLLATGVTDVLPDIPGVRACFGVSVHHCPYCDGWEWRDKRIAVYGRGRSGVGPALTLSQWSADVVVCSDGPIELHGNDAARLAEHRIEVREQPIAALRSRGGRLEHIDFADGSSLRRDAMFFNTGWKQQCDLAERLGCRCDEEGAVITDQRERTGVTGLWVAGDASHDVQFVIVAAAEGAKAAVAINREFLEDERRVAEE